jgi:hypothetical protein
MCDHHFIRDRHGDKSCDHYHQRVYRMAAGADRVMGLLQVTDDKPM